MGERDWLKIERNQLKIELGQLKALVEGFRASLTKAHEEAIQEYRVDFKETRDYLDILNDAPDEYKASLKRVDLSFDAEYYDNLILE